MSRLFDLKSGWRLSLAGILLAGIVYAQPPAGPEPIAYIGHGAMFDQNGREIAPSVEFLQTAQAWYRASLMSRLTPAQRNQFNTREQNLKQNVNLDPQSRLVADAELIEWLITTANPEDADRMKGKNNLIKNYLKYKLPDKADKNTPRSTVPFSVNPTLRQRMSNQPKPQAANPRNGAVLQFLTNSGGAAYRQLCSQNGVPIPPDMGNSQWVSRGEIPQGQLFIVGGMRAEVLTYQSASPRGMCVALPRFDNSNTVQLDGVICLGATSKACFWDNQKDGNPFTFQRGTSRPFADFGGGTELRESIGGICSDCHSGENPYIIHDQPLNSLAGLGLPTFAPNWHEPFVRTGDTKAWPENPGPIAAPASCGGCHVQGSAGRFPQLSTASPGYCGSVLGPSIERTMPPGSPGSLANSQEMINFRAQCGTAPPSPAPGAPIWRYTGTLCNGESCPGWQRLDRNPKTVAITSAGSKLYQLHNDGWIWRHTGTPCTGDSCPGWQRLDRNAKTIAIAAGGDQLYQLHNDGWIWRFTGTPCNGESCPGWQRLDRNANTVAIAAGGSQLYQLHRDGRIWRFTGTACNGESCPGWQQLDMNSSTVAIAANASSLYQLHKDGRIWRFTGTPCSGNSCPGWQPLDQNSKTIAIAAGGSGLYQLHNDGWIWKHTGAACNGPSCPGWQRLDRNSKTVAIVATDNGLFQKHHDGWIWRHTGTPCQGESCPGWQRLDNNSRTGMLAGGEQLFQLHGDALYQLHNDGAIWRSTGTPCNGDSCPGWQRLDRNPATKQIVAAGTQLFQRHADGKIWRHTGVPCSGDSCPGWQMVDNNSATKLIAAAGNQLYQLHSNGRIWRFTGTGCTSATNCPGWQMVDANPATISIAAGGNQLFQLHNNGRIWRHTGVACTSATDCPGWQMIDANPATVAIAASNSQLFQLHNNGRIWRHTGTACTSATNCPGWQMLDANSNTKAIAAGGNQLYQLHNDGKIWRSTGTGCSSATNCPGWQMVDNNAATRDIVVSAEHLYQRHSSGAIWRHTGTPCAGNSCPGWIKLDGNSRTIAIAAGGF